MNPAVEAAMGVLLRAARETATARRLAGDSETALLQSVVDAKASLFEAEASSVADSRLRRHRARAAMSAV